MLMPFEEFRRMRRHAYGDKYMERYVPVGADPKEIEKEELEGFDLIVLSPGPGIPDEAGILKEVISYYSSKKPIFGVCLGLQAIVEVFGGSIENLTEVFHGVSTPMYTEVDDALLFQGVASGFEAARYHSWIAFEDDFPDSLEITARDGQGQIMAIRHRDFPIHAVQFHPEFKSRPYL